MNPIRTSPPLRRRLIVIGLLVLLSLLLSSPARADIGIESANRSAGVAGDEVRLTVGCGFCFPPCEGEPGRRHPRGQRSGTCMLGTQRNPPAAFPVWLTSLKHSLEPYRCGSDDACAAGSSRPPHLPSFVYLGRAMRLSERERIESGDTPSYRLEFQIPETPPGLYKYVVYCDVCYAGPRGNLIESPNARSGRLQILPSDSSGGAGGGGVGSGLWIVAGAVIAIAALAFGLHLWRSRVTGSQAGPAA